MIRVLLVDDHEVVRAGLRALLEATGHVDVVGEASSGEEAVTKARTLEPDIVIMDLAMPGMDGVQATRGIAALELDTRVLVLTIHDEDEFLVPAMEAGAAGFLNKSAADTDLIGAVEAVARGHSYLPRRAAALIARKRTAEAPKSGPGSIRGALGAGAHCDRTVRAGLFGEGGRRGTVRQSQDRRGLHRPREVEAGPQGAPRHRALRDRDRAPGARVRLRRLRAGETPVTVVEGMSPQGWREFSATAKPPGCADLLGTPSPTERCRPIRRQLQTVRSAMIVSIRIHSTGRGNNDADEHEQLAEIATTGQLYKALNLTAQRYTRLREEHCRATARSSSGRVLASVGVSPHAVVRETIPSGALEGSR